MTAYFIRRLLLIPFTLLGVTLLVFAIVRSVPGGPIEEERRKMMGGGDKGHSSRGREQSGSSLTPEMILQLEEKFDQDKSMLRSYGEWLGVLKKDTPGNQIRVGKVFPDDSDEVSIAIPGSLAEVQVKLDGKGGFTCTPPPDFDFKGWELRLQGPVEQRERWQRRVPEVPLDKDPPPRVLLFKPGYDGLLQGSLGVSMNYQEPVWNMIIDRLPVSLFYGAIDMILIYGICIPLGVLKALKHRSWIDNWTSVVVFAGYAIPGYALGSLLVVFLGGHLGWFPLRGFTGDDFDSLDTWGKVKDLFNHAVMPVICYMVGSFAFLTLLMKNNLMDNLAADYVRTAVAKGVGFRRAVFRHAIRNSMIPIASTFGANLSLLVGGSILIEKVFDINGFGLLQYNSLMERDQNLMMGLVAIGAILMMLGNVISDFCVALVDPRVSYK